MINSPAANPNPSPSPGPAHTQDLDTMMELVQHEIFPDLQEIPVAQLQFFGILPAVQNYEANPTPLNALAVVNASHYMQEVSKTP